jgi:hypothetical protein
VALPSRGGTAGLFSASTRSPCSVYSKSPQVHMDEIPAAQQVNKPIVLMCSLARRDAFVLPFSERRGELDARPGPDMCRFVGGPFVQRETCPCYLVTDITASRLGVIPLTPLPHMGERWALHQLPATIASAVNCCSQVPSRCPTRSYMSEAYVSCFGTHPESESPYVGSTL